MLLKVSYSSIDVVAVSGDMGHSVVGTTLNLYSHMFRKQEYATAIQSPKLLTSGHEKSHSITAVAYIIS